MSFVEMTNAEWDEVRRHHDDLVRMGELEMQAEEIREAPRASKAPAPVELPMRATASVVTSIQR